MHINDISSPWLFRLGRRKELLLEFPWPVPWNWCWQHPLPNNFTLLVQQYLCTVVFLLWITSSLFQSFTCHFSVFCHRRVVVSTLCAVYSTIQVIRQVTIKLTKQSKFLFKYDLKYRLDRFFNTTNECLFINRWCISYLISCISYIFIYSNIFLFASLMC